MSNSIHENSMKALMNPDKTGCSTCNKQTDERVKEYLDKIAKSMTYTPRV